MLCVSYSRLRVHCMIHLSVEYIVSLLISLYLLVSFRHNNLIAVCLRVCVLSSECDGYQLLTVLMSEHELTHLLIVRSSIQPLLTR